MPVSSLVVPGLTRHPLYLILYTLPDSGCLRVSRTLGKGPIALGIRFAESRTRQRALGKQRDGKAGFAECFLSGTRQRLCRVHFDTRQKNKREMKNTHRRRHHTTIAVGRGGCWGEDSAK